MCTINYPRDIELENTALGLMIVKPELIKTACRILSNLDFYSLKNQLVFVALREMFGKGKSIDLALLYNYMNQNNGQELTIGAGYISSLLDGVPRSSIRNFEVYCIKIKQLSMLRDIQRKCYEAMKGINNNFDSTKALLVLRRRIDEYLRYNSVIKKQDNFQRGKNDNTSASIKM